MLEIFSQFVAAFPNWKLWQLGDNHYCVAYKPYAGYDDFENYPVLGFYLTLVTEANFNGISLNYREGGYSYNLDGKTGKAAIRR